MDGDESFIQLIPSTTSSVPFPTYSSAGTMVSMTVGRVMTLLLNARPKKLRMAISSHRALPKMAAPVDDSLEQCLLFLNDYVSEAEQIGEHLDQVLVPMIQHMLRVKESKHGYQTLILLNWLFQDEKLFQAVASDLAAIIVKKDDRHLALGWCMLGRSLIEYDNYNDNLETDGISGKYAAILMTFWSCSNHLLSIICNGSITQDGFELPTRLAVSAADLVLSLIVASSKVDISSQIVNINQKQPKPLPNVKSSITDERVANAFSKALQTTPVLESKLILWDNLNTLITLVNRLTAWSRKSRSLHVKGLERVSKWLQRLQKQYGCSHIEEDKEILITGSLLLSSCWKHFGILLHLDDRKFSQQWKELLDQYLSGIRFYSSDVAEEPNMNEHSRSDTISFFLNCLLLLLGRLDILQFQNALAEFGSHITQVVMSQLHCSDEEVIDGVISIFRAVVFRTNQIFSHGSLHDTGQMDTVLPLLLSFLDEQDVAAKAVVKLVAEYCSVCSDVTCLREVLKRMDSTNVAQRRNTIEFIAEIIYLSSGSVAVLSQGMWQDIADNLLKCITDEDCVVQKLAVDLIQKIEAQFVLPTLVRLSISVHEKVNFVSSTIIITLLNNHKQCPNFLCLLISCLGDLCLNSDHSGNPTGIKEGSALDGSGLLKLLPRWAENVEDWNAIAGPLIDKMLAEPSNVVIVKFLSHISEYLAVAAEIIFDRLLSYAKKQKEIEECSTKEALGAKTDAKMLEHRLFIHLCPLLVIRLLPLRVFDNQSSNLYGSLSTFDLHEDAHFKIDGTSSIAALLINRALSKSEFEDVRKLSAELCGRLHPNFLIPIISSQLEQATISSDLFDIKVCLFSLCVSLTIRGSQVYKHPNLFRIRKIIHSILNWPSADKDEIFKVQHGCIDCLALMLCTELQDFPSSKPSNLEKKFPDGQDDSTFRGSIQAYVINQLTDDGMNKYDRGEKMSPSKTDLSFRLCMANVLITTCQKISETGKKPYVKKILPVVILAFGEILESDIRAAIIQLLFSIVFQMKSLIIPYSSDLLDITLKSFRGGSTKEKIASTKLLTCLMANEDVIESLAGGLLEAKALLQDLSSSDLSLDVQQMCKQLLLCFT